MTVTWRDELSIDDGPIDEDHKHLIAIINGFYRAAGRRVSVDVLDSALQYLKQYTLQHFQREEEIQTRIGYPFAEAHRREHRDLIRRLDQIVAEARQDKTRENPDTLTDNLFSLLKDWLLTHVVKADIRMKPYMERNKARLAGPADVLKAAWTRATPEQRMAFREWLDTQPR